MFTNICQRRIQKQLFHNKLRWSIALAIINGLSKSVIKIKSNWICKPQTEKTQDGTAFDLTANKDKEQSVIKFRKITFFLTPLTGVMFRILTVTEILILITGIM